MVILCYISNIKLQMDPMGRGYVLQVRDQDRKLRNTLLSTAMGGSWGCVKSDLRWFKSILAFIFLMSWDNDKDFGMLEL